ncbi:Glutamyl-tRNA(Gln) amidotransferase subunit A [Cupriavidus laharis]|uniref:Glutamyl-tRNA(Gln) amidotransferase subunit A n=2 Tax=Cupriavidus laharis TaxID=151654 RepID=A0ABN7Z181_9BURK|nr:Glutamyl-tRNA(Gln) amidotransferase subunit A [Cupriavidus laharis]
MEEHDRLGKGAAAMSATMSDLLQPGLNGAFVRDGFGSGPRIDQTSSRLAGLRLAVKDVFHVAGLRTGAGNPVWRQDQPVSPATAPAVAGLLAAGASWVGKTVTDELAFSLSGINLHYGTPVNPACPRRLPGGSSSGSAVAVASGDADIGLATDCGGSARLPASYCGVWGIRPTHGLLAGTAGFPLAPAFDTVGWFARSAVVMAQVLEVLAPPAIGAAPALYWIAEDAIAACDPEVQAALRELHCHLELPLQTLAAGTLPLGIWATAHRLLQGAEIWQQHGDWVTQHGHTLAEDVLSRFLAASHVSASEVAVQSSCRLAAKETLSTLLRDDSVLLLPTAPGIAPLCTNPEADLASNRLRAQLLLCPAGLAGLPQVSFPWITVQGAPVGLSVIGPRGADAMVMKAATIIEAMLSSG